MRRLTLALLLVAIGCSSTDEPLEPGPPFKPADGGTIFIDGGTRDAGNRDAGDVAADAGDEADAGVVADAGVEPDAGEAPDASAPADGGVVQPDGGPTATDAGALRDAGANQRDAGPTPRDAGPAPGDAGTTNPCGSLGARCASNADCPGAVCDPVVSVCVPRTMPTCGGFVGAQCPSETPVCMFYAGADFGICFTAGEQMCECATGPGRMAFPVCP